MSQHDRILEIRPDAELFEETEEYQEQGRSIRIEFYKTPEGRYFVWPYISQGRRSRDTMKHFVVKGHFPDRKTARNATLERGRALIAAGFHIDWTD
jgi:hypothetical protein